MIPATDRGNRSTRLQVWLVVVLRQLVLVAVHGAILGGSVTQLEVALSELVVADSLLTNSSSGVGPLVVALVLADPAEQLVVLDVVVDRPQVFQQLFVDLRPRGLPVPVAEVVLELRHVFDVVLLLEVHRGLAALAVVESRRDVFRLVTMISNPLLRLFLGYPVVREVTKVPV